MAAEKATRLYPAPQRELPASDIHRDLSFPGRRGALPYLVVNMVSSLDGRSSVRGKASPIGSPTDRAVMGNLRDGADAVMVGASTMRAEKLSLSVPIAAVVSRSGDVPFDNLVGSPPGEMFVFSQDGLGEEESGSIEERANLVTLQESDFGPFLGASIEYLKAHSGAESVLLEGGPSLAHAAVSYSIVNELFLTLSPKLFGGYTDTGFSNLLDGPPFPEERNCTLTSIHLSKDELFLRYRLD